MIYVGIDVAKQDHFASLISSDKSLLGRSNSQTTVMASSISFPPSNHSTTKRSSSVLNQRLIIHNLIRYLVAELQCLCPQSAFYFFHAEKCPQNEDR